MKPNKYLRPTTSKVRESLLATLAPRLPGARVLDLFAGTGTLGLCALQAGASEVVAVESCRHTVQQLRNRLGRRIVVIRGVLPEALRRIKGKFSVVFADPPYGSRAGRQTLERLLSWLSPGAVVVYEHHHKEFYPEEVGSLVMVRRRRFGETSLSYYVNMSSCGGAESSEGNCSTIVEAG